MATRDHGLTPAMSIIMPCYNRAYDLLHILQAYERQEGGQPFEIIAVDDASSDSTFELLQNYRSQRFDLRVMHMENNSGQGLVRNLAITQVRAPIVAFVGDDIFPENNFVSGHLAAHQRRPELSTAVLGRITWPEDLPTNTLMRYIDGVGAKQFSFHYLKDGEEYDFRHFYTSNISLKTEFLNIEKEWFSPDFYLYGYEDVELGYRLFRRGLQIFYDAGILARHYHYHTSWSFSVRQRRAGLMAGVLLRKHPSLIYIKRFFFLQHYQRIVWLFCRPDILRSTLPSGTLDELELFACRLASFYEWADPQPHGLNQLYDSVLDYFYFASFIEDFVGRKIFRRWVRSAHARLYLIPALIKFRRLTRRFQEPYPEHFNLPMFEQQTTSRSFTRGSH